MEIKQEIKLLKKKKIKEKSAKEANLFVDQLLKKMTLEEKVGQLSQTYYYHDVCTGPEFESDDTILEIKKGHLGSILNVVDPQKVYALQKVAVEETRLHIPLMFMLDVIHGYKTSFPTPLAMSCSFNAKLIEKAAHIAAKEASHSGISVTFSPMLDLIKDARWGRVNESNGEDPYLNAVLAKAYVQGYQGKHLCDENSIGACCKHYIGYGAVQAGREYHMAEIAPLTMYQDYLPGFKAAFSKDVLGVMFAFNSINHVPMSCNQEYTQDLLRKKMKYDGFSISDFGAVSELVSHKVAKDSYEAAKLCLQAGLDQEMVSRCYRDHLLALCEKEKKYISYVNQSCRRILKAKYRLGLFDDPYKNIFDQHEQYYMNEKDVETSYQIACQSIVLLKNELLPLSKKTKVCLIGPYSHNKKMVGPWGGLCSSEDNISIYEAIKADGDIQLVDLGDDVKNAAASDVCILCLGEEEHMSGEGGSRVELSLPPNQEELLKQIARLNKPIVSVLFAGRPLVLTPYIDQMQSILYSFYLGMQGGKAIKDILFGDVCPSAKLSVSFPRNVGQLPLSYQDYPSGRPINESETTNNRFTSHYIDCKNSPLFSFSEGLSYNTYCYRDFEIIKQKLHGKKDKIEISFTIENEGKYGSEEIAFMFIEATYASVTRPTNELKAFKRVKIKPHEKVKVTFIVSYNELKYYNLKLKEEALDGMYKIKIGSNLHKVREWMIEFVN